MRAVVVVGSYARREARADRWSDVDVLLFVDDPRSYADDADWVTHFGIPVLTFLEPTSVGDRVERRVLYEDGPTWTSCCWRRPRCGACGSARGRYGPVARIPRAHDEIGVGDALADAAAHEPQGFPTRPRSRSSRATSGTTACGRRRSSAAARSSPRSQGLDGYMKWRLLVLLEWHARAVDPSVDTWHNGRFLERWADAGALAALERAYAHYNVRDVAGHCGDNRPLPGPRVGDSGRLGLAVALDHADLRRRIGGRPRSALCVYPLAVSTHHRPGARARPARGRLRRRRRGLERDDDDHDRAGRPRFASTSCATARSGPCSARSTRPTARRTRRSRRCFRARPLRRGRISTLTTAIPESGEDAEVSIEDGVATRSSTPIEEGLAQVVYTLTQFPEVEEVEVQEEFATRADFEDLTPAILVESPLAFEDVASPLRVMGTANTFEANFQYELTDTDGRIVDESFVTATSGSGTRGTSTSRQPPTPSRSTGSAR